MVWMVLALLLVTKELTWWLLFPMCLYQSRTHAYKQWYQIVELQLGSSGSSFQNEYTWWRHQMETFSALLAICAGNSLIPVNSPHKGQLHGALIAVWINGWVNNLGAGDLRRNPTHYDVIAMDIADVIVTDGSVLKNIRRAGDGIVGKFVGNCKNADSFTSHWCLSNMLCVLWHHWH